MKGQFGHLGSASLCMIVHASFQTRVLLSLSLCSLISSLIHHRRKCNSPLCDRIGRFLLKCFLFFAFPNFFHSHQLLKPNLSFHAREEESYKMKSNPQLRITNQKSFPDLGFKRPRIPLSVNRSKLSIPYKSQLCIPFQHRKCFYGENCHFAHNPSEIRQAAALKTVAMQHASERNGVWRRQECRFFSSGMSCPFGDNCQFLHKCDENFGGNESGLNRVSGDSIECRNICGGSNSIYHKTRLCDKWYSSGCCPYGKKCTYAHGREEVRGIGYYAQLEHIRASRLMLDSQPSFGSSCKIGIENAMKEDIVPIMDRNIAKISEIYADWVGVGHDFSMSR